MRKPNPNGCQDEDSRLVNHYRKAVMETIPLISPRQIEDVLRRISKEPDPPSIFGPQVPDTIRNLYAEARIARERYLAQLSEEVIRRTSTYAPITSMEDERFPGTTNRR